MFYHKKVHCALSSVFKINMDDNWILGERGNMQIFRRSSFLLGCLIDVLFEFIVADFCVAIAIGTLDDVNEKF